MRPERYQLDSPVGRTLMGAKQDSGLCSKNIHDVGQSKDLIQDTWLSRHWPWLPACWVEITCLEHTDTPTPPHPDTPFNSPFHSVLQKHSYRSSSVLVHFHIKLLFWFYLHFLINPNSQRILHELYSASPSPCQCKSSAADLNRLCQFEVLCCHEVLCSGSSTQCHHCTRLSSLLYSAR